MRLRNNGANDCKQVLVSLAAFFGFLSVAPDAISQEEEAAIDADGKTVVLEEIIVTAERRSENIYNLPIAVSAFSGQALNERGIEDFEQLQQLSPSFQVAVQPGLNVRLSMRGVHAIQDEESPVSINWDGVPYADPILFSGNFFDVDRIEILRGPQGTLGGRTASAGAMYVHSNRPTEDLEGSLKARFGNYQRIGLEGVVSGPVAGDRLLGRLAVRTERADGWITNTFRDEKYNSIDETQARLSLLSRVTDNLDVLLILENYHNRSVPLGGAVYVDDGRLRPDQPTFTEALGVPAFDRDNHTVSLDAPNEFDVERSNGTLRVDWALGEGAQLTAITGYVDYDKLRGEFDTNGTELVGSILNRVSKSIRHVSQEVSLTADINDRLDMIVGAQYLDNETKDAVGLDQSGLPLVVESGESLVSWAGYTQWRYRMTDKVRLTTGVRYTNDSKEEPRLVTIGGVPNPLVRVEESWDAWTPRFSIDYSASDDLLLYTSVSRGFKGGALSPTQVFTAVGPESVWNYELGMKSGWLDGRMHTALTAFYMDYTNLQQSLQRFDPVEQRIVSGTVNAGSASITGVELELDTLITDQMRLTFSGTWLDGTYDDLQQPDPLFPEVGTPLPEVPDGPNFRNLSGNQLARSAKWKFNVSGEYRTHIGGLATLNGDWEGVLSATYSWQDKTYFSFFNHEGGSQDAYGLVNLYGALETTDGAWQFSVFAHNVTDEHYYTEAGVAPASGGNPPRTTVFVGAPRTYGVNLAYRF